MFNTIYSFRGTDTVGTVFVGIVAKAFKTADVSLCKRVASVCGGIAKGIATSGLYSIYHLLSTTQKADKNCPL